MAPEREPMADFQFTFPPPCAGYMTVLPGYLWQCPRKPSWWHRLWMRALLGWRWTDEGKAS